MKSNLRQVTNSVSQGPNLQQTLFSIFSNDLDNGTESVLSSFADGTKPGAVASTPEGYAAIQRGLESLEK